MQRRRLLALVVALVAACADDVVSNTPDAAPVLDAPMLDAPMLDAPARDAPDVIVVLDARSPDVPSRDVAPPDAPVAARCRTRVTYGEAWIRPAGHDEAFDEVDGLVTWDGVCTDDGANSYAALSNGWRPYFAGNGRCAIAFDTSNCAGASGACATRLTYGSAWSHPTGHPTQYDDVGGLAAWDGVCHRDGASSFAVLSNGWRPYFRGGLCAVSVRQTQCGDRYVNPVIGGDCPDPGVLRDGGDYYLVCTSGNAADAFPMRASRDLVHWRAVGPVFPAARRPAWAASDFWAPEIHRVGARYVVYYTARRAGGQLAIGAASAPTPTGPYTDLGRPLLEDASMGLIDATAFRSMDGSLYLYWKDDGNARGRPTPIHGQRLAADGLSLTGARATLLTNDLSWEGALIEGPWVISHDGAVYLFYSANAYYDGRYAVGVARAASPLGPFVKRGAPILVTNAAFAGPGHGSVVEGPSGDTVFVYHAWRAGFAGVAGNGRAVLVDRVAWSGGWPSLPGAPSSAPQRLP